MAASGHGVREHVDLGGGGLPRDGRTDLDPEELERLKTEYFATPRACLRASPLGRTFGWGLHFDAEGRITLHAVGSESYARLAADPSLVQLRAMRSKRA